MLRCTLSLSFWLLSISLSFSQQMDLQFKLIDAATQLPIAEAHLFVSESSLGAISDPEGNCKLQIPAMETQALIITHVAYETLVLKPAEYAQLMNGAKLPMQSNGIDLNEIQITATRGNSWKRNFKKFRKALLGKGKAAASCEILNPEVLRFEVKQGQLSATAVDLLEIENKHLQYRIRFLLTKLVVEADGSTEYKGNAQFIDKCDEEDLKLIKLRERVYQNSLARFLRAMVESPDKNALNRLGYQIAFEKYDQGIFQMYIEPEPQGLLELDSLTGLYLLRFSDFLAVKHVKHKVQEGGNEQISISSAELQKFGSGASQLPSGGMMPAVSRLFKIAPALIFDQRGNIINKEAVKEYGFWANQRLANTLPVDYKKFENSIETKVQSQGMDTLAIFRQFIMGNPQKRAEAYRFLADNWSPSFVAPLLDILRISGDDWLLSSVKKLLDQQVPSIEADYYQGLSWLWKEPSSYGNYYADFKAFLYKNIDPKFQTYFENRNAQSKIRLDEIVWGGVKQDGIPPLRSPKMLAGGEATYLGNKDVVFGLLINGQAYAYPKRILAWHEFFTDTINGQSIAGVYCTLCGTVIIYDTKVKGLTHELGTSGFLYRSNKLMYDKATQSLWSTLLGKPVLGPLVNQAIEMDILPVETSTWADWFKRYPTTKVLSLDTGHQRNYDEGVAYADYFSTDNLMFPVPTQDDRLQNKNSVLIPRTANYAKFPLAISVDYLQRKGWHIDQMGEQRIIILTDKSGASRVYEVGEEELKSYKHRELVGKDGNSWELYDDRLLSPAGMTYPRIPAHETFWFAWVNVFPTSRLVQ